MKITTARVEPHMVATAEDFEYGFQSLIRNIAAVDRLMVSANSDYVCGGVMRPAGGMTFKFGAIWANGKALELPVFSHIESEPVVITAPSNYPRHDTVQVQGKLESFDEQRRGFFESDLEIVRYLNIDTKNRLVAKIEVKQGVEGSACAPDADNEWIKLGEIYTKPDTEKLEDENIKNITASVEGEGNAGWTNEQGRTFLVKSWFELWSEFSREHYTDGRHRGEVIKKENILLGVSQQALKASDISLGNNVAAGGMELNAAVKIDAAIGKVMQGTGKRLDAVRQEAAEQKEKNIVFDNRISRNEVDITANTAAINFLEDRIEQLLPRIVGEYREVGRELTEWELVKYRLLQPYFQLIEIAKYRELCDFKYCGDDDNNTARWWYKCDHLGNRTITGLWMRVEDRRGLFARCAGANAAVRPSNDTLYDAKEAGEFIGDAIRLLPTAHLGGVFTFAGAQVQPPFRTFIGVRHAFNYGTQHDVAHSFLDMSTLSNYPTAHENRAASLSANVYIAY